MLASNSYRTWEDWTTSALRTYLRDLYVRIPREYLMESETVFYTTTYDRFQMYALVELAGAKHIKSIPNFLYWYKTSSYSECSLTKSYFYEYISKTQTPLLPLKELNCSAKITPDYAIPDNLTQLLNYYERKYEECKSQT